MSLQKINAFISEEERDYQILNSLLSSIINNTNNEFNVLLSGGNTVKSFYKVLYSRYMCEYGLFSNVNFYFMDERIVSLDSDASNYGQFIRSCEFDERIISSTTPLTMDNFSIYEGVRHWDWALFGLGIDGHVASIFDRKMRNNRIYKTTKVNGYERYTLSLDTLSSVSRKILIINADYRKWSIIENGDMSYPVNNLQYEIYGIHKESN